MSIPFSKEELETLTRYYPTHSAKYISELLNRPLNSIYLKANRLGLKKEDQRCKFDGCECPAVSREYCSHHYTQVKRSGGFYNIKCSVEGCDRLISHIENTLCYAHYEMQYHKEHSDKFQQYRRTFNAKETEEDKVNKKQYLKQYNTDNFDILKEKRLQYNLDNKAFLKVKKINKTLQLIKQALDIYDNKCVQCEASDIEVLEWHHIQKTSLTRSAIRYINTKGMKCAELELVCANCHIHHNIRDNTNRQGISNLKSISYDYLPKDAREIDTLKCKQQALFIYDCRCQLCNNSDVIVLQWHHRIQYKPREGMLDTQRRIIRSGVKVEDIMLLCANCHKKQDLVDKTGNRNSLVSTLKLDESYKC